MNHLKIVGAAVFGAALLAAAQLAGAAEQETLGAACERQAKQQNIQGEEAIAMYVSECVEAFNTARAQAPASGEPAADGAKDKQGE